MFLSQLSPHERPKTEEKEDLKAAGLFVLPKILTIFYLGHLICLSV